MSFEDFKLSPKQLEFGLSEAELTRWCKKPVFLAHFSDFPHWESLKKGGLSTAQREERQSAIYEHFLHRGVWREVGGPFKSAGYVQDWADCKGAMVSSEYAPIEDFQPKMMQFAPEGVLEKPVQITKALQRAACTIFGFRNNEESAESVFPNFITPERRAQISSRYMYTHIQLHEAVHGQQDTYPNEQSVSYYQERHAEAASLWILLHSGVPHSFVETIVNRRYLGMLWTTPQYWFADTIRNFPKKSPSLGFDDTAFAVKEVQLRTSMALDGVVQEAVEPQEMAKCVRILCDGDRTAAKRLKVSAKKLALVGRHNNAWHNKLVEVYWGDPQLVLGSLQGLVDRRDIFSPHAQYLATQICKAARYFNPEITKPRSASKGPMAAPR